LNLTPYSGWAESCLVDVYLQQGKGKEAERLLEQLLERKKKTFVSSYCIAHIYHSLEDLDKTLEFLEKAYEERDTLMPFINVFLEFGKVRSEPRFKAILEKMGF
jgi:pentatricopeptide repeat protein